MAPSILIDSASSKITYVGAQWQLDFDQSTQGGSYESCRTDTMQDGSAPSISLSFQGTGVEFFGQPTEDFKLNYTIDGSQPQEANIQPTKDIPGKTGIRLWGVEDLTPQAHSISLIPIRGQPLFDYAVVTPIASTPLNGETIVVDDNEPAIQYNGNWQLNVGTQFTEGIPFSNTRRGTNRKGDTFKFQFVGSSISVYGLLNQQSGILSSTYSIDGAAPTRFVAYNDTQEPAPNVWALHQRFFYQEVDPGNHTLVVTVEEITNTQAFWFDYLTYEGIPSTSLTFTNSSRSGADFRIKLIGGLIGLGVLLAILFSVLRVRYNKRMKARKRSSQSQTVEVPNRPMVLRQPPHLTTEDDLIQEENGRVYGQLPLHYLHPATALDTAQGIIRTVRNQGRRIYVPPPPPYLPPSTPKDSEGDQDETAAHGTNDPAILHQLRENDWQTNVTVDSNTRRRDTPPSYDDAKYIS